MGYEAAKIKSYNTFKDAVQKMQESGGNAKAASNMWCEFCGKNQKRWDVSLVKGDQQDKIKDAKTAKLLKGIEADFLLACDPCTEELELEILETEQAGKFDGEKIAMYELLEAVEQ